MKKSIVIFFLLPLLTFGQANKFYRQGMRATDINEQISLFSQAIESDPKHFDAYFQRAVAKDHLGDYNGAILDYTKVIFYEPGADSYYNRANSKYEIKDYIGARDDYAKALELNPQFITARYCLAYTKYDLKDYEGSIEDLNMVIKVYPSNSSYYRHRAFAYSALKKHLEALKDFSTVIMLSPTSDAYYNRGTAFMEINYYQKANYDFNAAINADKDNILAYFFKATSHFFLGEYDNAFLYFNTAINFDTFDYDAIFGLALTHYKTGDFENAKLEFEKAERILTSISETSETKKGVELFENSYWFLNQYYTFHENYQKLSKL